MTVQRDFCLCQKSTYYRHFRYRVKYAAGENDHTVLTVNCIAGALFLLMVRSQFPTPVSLAIGKGRMVFLNSQVRVLKAFLTSTLNQFKVGLPVHKYLFRPFGTAMQMKRCIIHTLQTFLLAFIEHIGIHPFVQSDTGAAFCIVTPASFSASSFARTHRSSLFCRSLSLFPSTAKAIQVSFSETSANAPLFLTSKNSISPRIES